MNDVELYLKFREELDKICVPEILKCVEAEPIYCDEKKVGIFCHVEQPYFLYIDCVYVLPEYRNRGLATEKVIEWYRKQKKKEIRLHIINENKPALKFWTSLFNLEAIEWNGVDSLFRIMGEKEGRMWRLKLL